MSKLKRIIKHRKVKNNIGLIISDFAIEIGADTSELNIEKFNKAHSRCMKRIYKHIFPYGIQEE